MPESRFPYEALSPWVEVPADLQPALAEDVDVDAVVIGAGYTGLATALALRDAGLDVAVLERDFAGSGASGRNGGHLRPTIGKEVPTFLGMFGEARATRLLRFADAAVEHGEETIRKHDIDCDYAATGNIMAGVHPKQECALRRAAGAAERAGAAVRFVPPGEMRERGVPPAFLFGAFEERGGSLHPGRYVMGLRRAAIRAGVRLFERTPLVALEDGPRVTARCEHGSVRADAAVLATNAYTPQTGRRRRLVSPLRVTLFETAPLAEADLEALGWAGREGIYTAHELLESYRLTAQRTIVGGSKRVLYAYGSRLAEGYAPDVFRFVEAAFRDRFPTLDAVPVARFWGGWIGMTVDFLPAIGVDGPHRNVHFGLGFNGHGVAQATLMGALLAEQVQGRTHPWADAIARNPWSWPPEPLRWLGAKAILATLGALDARVDRGLHRRPAGR